VYLLHKHPKRITNIKTKSEKKACVRIHTLQTSQPTDEHLTEMLTAGVF